jgi:hypothetical protein
VALIEAEGTLTSAVPLLPRLPTRRRLWPDNRSLVVDHGMCEPCNRMASNIPIALGYIRPIGVVFEPEEYTGSTLICALGQDNRITVAEFRTNKCRADHIRLLVRHYIDCGAFAEDLSVETRCPVSSSLATCFFKCMEQTGAALLSRAPARPCTYAIARIEPT